MSRAVPATGVSEYLRVRGLRLHLRRFGPINAPILFLLHGWLDASASFAPVIERLLERAGGQLQVIAPDGRGFGYSEWAVGDYWFPDYVADLDAVVEHYAADAPVLLAGHSMGAQVVSLYAGLRPQRVHKLVLMDALGVPDMPAERAPARITRWLDQQRAPPVHRPYESFDALAQRVCRQHPRLDTAQADFVARCWAREDVQGRVHLLADPKHRFNGPGLYRATESEAVWRQVIASTLILYAGDSEFRESISAAARQRRQDCFRTHRVLTVPAVGHMLHFEAPQATADALADFLLEPTCA